MLFKLSNLNSNLALTLGYLNPPLNKSALEIRIASSSCHPQLVLRAKGNILRLQTLTILNRFLLLVFHTEFHKMYKSLMDDNANFQGFYLEER